jgi:hypothetical protein
VNSVILYRIFAIVASFSVLVPLWYAVKRINEIKQNRTFLILFIYLISSLLAELASLLLILTKSHSDIVFDYFSLIELVLIIGIFMFSGLFSKTEQRFSMLGLLICIAMFGLARSAGWIGYFTGAGRCLIISLNIYAFYKLVTSREDGNYAQVKQDPFFSLNSAIFIYFSSTFLIFLLKNFMTTELSSKVIWTLFLCFNIVFYLLVTRAICKLTPE